MIAAFVSVAGSEGEAAKIVDEEIAKGDCVPIPKHLRDERIHTLWLQRKEAEEWLKNYEAEKTAV